MDHYQILLTIIYYQKKLLLTLIFATTNHPITELLIQAKVGKRTMPQPAFSNVNKYISGYCVHIIMCPSQQFYIMQYMSESLPFTQVLVKL